MVNVNGSLRSSIIERGRQLAGIEIKATAGVVFYDGEDILPFGERLHAVPISILPPKPSNEA